MAKNRTELKLIEVRTHNFSPYMYYDGHFMMLPMLMGPLTPRTPHDPSVMGSGSYCAIR